MSKWEGGQGSWLPTTRCEAPSSVAVDSAATTSSSSSSSTTTTTKRPRSSRTSDDESLVEFGVSLALSVGMAVVTGLAARYLVNQLERIMRMDADGNPTDATAIEKRLLHILQKRGQTTLPPLDHHELQMAQVVVDPDDIDASFADIGGLDNTKREIYELAILPLLEPELFTGKLVQPCKGILLYGKPGTGKTMLAKALAKEATAVFIPLQLSKILNKYVGESNKMIAACFTLATKLAPAIIFIDELDTFLKANTTETAYLDLIKSEFLTWWDGVGTSSNSQVLVLGATNKPQAIDPAILRRMPRAFAVPLPDEQGRKAILAILFQDERLTQEARAFLPVLAKKTVGYSGSDLKELAKAAAMVSVQERTADFARQRVMGQASTQSHVALQRQKKQPLRPISVEDLITAVQKVPKTGDAARSYGRYSAAEEQREQRAMQPNNSNNDSNSSAEEASLRNLMTLMRAMSNLSDDPFPSMNANNDDSNNGASSPNGDDQDEIPDLN